MVTSKQNETKKLITQSIQKEWINPKEAHQEYGFSISTLAKWRMNNLHLPYSKIGKYIKYKRSNIEAYLNTNIVEVEGV